jgi:hypothetical protein
VAPSSAMSAAEGGRRGTWQELLADDTAVLGGLDVIDTESAERDRRPRWVCTSPSIK